MTEAEAASETCVLNRNSTHQPIMRVAHLCMHEYMYVYYLTRYCNIFW
jgi:hypothetical protein